LEKTMGGDEFKTLFVILCSLSAVAVCAAGTTMYVDANSPDDPGTGSFEDPFRAIQNAIDAAAHGDAVEIRPGVYAGQETTISIRQANQ
jgi:hypothetical protein